MVKNYHPEGESKYLAALPIPSWMVQHLQKGTTGKEPCVSFDLMNFHILIHFSL